MLPAMEKRIVSAALWFAAVVCMYELGWSLFDWPRQLGPIAALASAAFVLADPLQLFRRHRAHGLDLGTTTSMEPRRRLRPSPEL